jgi:uncharacterized protein
MSERIAVLYHGGCPDGFGGAYAAWKKFGDSAEYIPLSRDADPPTGLEGAQLYFIDFTYPQEIMDGFIAKAASVTVLDHHQGVEDIILRMPEYRYDVNHSGAYIAWEYFHPGTQVPRLLKYIEQGDLYRADLPHTEEILSYIYTRPQAFAEWSALDEGLAEPRSLKQIIEIGKAYAEHKSTIVEQIVRQAELVTFEGHTCYLGSCSKQFTSPVGHELAEQLPPIALVASVHAWGLRVSLRRSDDSIDLAALARRYGGNGHPFAAAFSLKWSDPIPWRPAVSHEDSRN